MESNKIDTLFRNKLERHQTPVSSQAWAKVNEQLKPKKKKYRAVWMVAASISLIALLTFSLIINNKEMTNSSMAESPIKLDNSAYSLAQSENKHNKEELPAVKKVTKSNTSQLNQRKFDQVAENNQTKAKSTIKPNSVDQSEKTFDFPKLEARQAILIAENTDVFQHKGIKKVETDIVVEINFSTQTQKTEIQQSKNKLKSLASELSIADIRAAKNELFASALQFDKKKVN